jgi:hypothetical protein
MSDTVVTAKFVADTSSLQAGANRVKSSLQGIDDGVRKSALGMNALKAGLLGAGAAAGMFALKVGIDAVQAAAEEEKAIIRLSTALNNVDQGFRVPQVEEFIDNLQRATGVADDELRPAMQALVTATGSATEAQGLLTIAMDVSAGTGKSLTAVSTALARASNGQFMQINRLTQGAMNPAIVATKDMTAVTAELSRLFGGQAQAAAETTAGKLDRLKIAYDELLETFGAGFIEGISNGSDALTDAGEALRAAEPGMREFGKTLGEVGRIVSYVSPFFDDMVNVFKFAIPSALASTAAAFPPLAPLVAFVGSTFLGAKAEVDAFVAAGERIPPMSGTVLAALEMSGEGIDEFGLSAEEAAEQIAAMKAEMDAFLAVTGAISAVDKAAASIDNLGTASVEFGTNLMGQTPKARDFRAQVITAFEDSAKAAQSLSDDLPTQRAIFTGELVKIVNALKASGVKPRDIEDFLGAMDGLPASVADIMRAAAKAVGDTDFKSQVEKAFDKSVKAGAPMTADAMARLAEGASKSAKAELGLTLEPELGSIIKSATTALRPTAFLNGELTGKSIGSGAAYGINQSSPIVIAAVERVMAQAKAAADAAVESGSPSRLFARTGDDMMAGVAMGWLRTAPTLYSSILSIIPRAKGEGSKLAKALAAGFTESLAQSGGSIASAISAVFGSIPAAKTPLEVKLGVKGAEKFIKDNKQALMSLVALGEKLDYIRERMDYAGEAFVSLGELVARPFGRPSQIAEMFGSDADINSVIDGFMNIRDQVTQAYAVLTDASIVGAKAAARNRAEMNRTIATLQNLASQAVELRNQYDAVMKEMADLEKSYQAEVDGINARYDAAEKTAEASIKAIEDKWASAIPKLESALQSATAAFDKENSVLQGLIQQRDQFTDSIKSGFRSFVNDLSFASRAGTKQIIRETKRLADGITVTLEREIETGGGPAAIRKTLEERLEAVRAFSRNIKSLMERGLDPTLVQEFVTAGVSGAGEAVAALAAGSQDDLTAINAVQKGLSEEANAFAKYASKEWHDAAIAQQEAIVGPLEDARDAAQKALNDGNALREQELTKARAHLEKLREDRRKELAAAEAEFTAEKARLQAEADALKVQMDAVAKQIEATVLTMINNTAARSAEAGVTAGKNLLAGFQKEYPGVYRRLNSLMDSLAASLTRTATVTVRTVYEAVMPVTPPTGKVPKREMGGPVSARTAYLVGERGPELFVPGASGNIIPNNQIGTVPAMGARYSGGGTSVININVSTGIGTDPAEVGRVVVEAIRKYERRSGPVFVSA